MAFELIYENYEYMDIKDTCGPGKATDSQDEGKAGKHRGGRCWVLMTVSLGLICVLLLVFIIMQHITITAERDLMKNTLEDLNQTISSLQDNHTHLMMEKHQLQDSFNSLSQKKLELETRVSNLTAENDQLKRSVESLSQKKLDLETELRNLTEKGKGRFVISTEKKSWSESRQYCRDHGGDLVIINTEEKQRFASSFVKEFVWIGLSDIEQEGSMRWVDNSPLSRGFWEINEPNDAGGNEDCVELNPKKSSLNNWNDIPCSAERKCICEI